MNNGVSPCLTNNPVSYLSHDDSDEEGGLGVAFNFLKVADNVQSDEVLVNRTYSTKLQ